MRHITRSMVILAGLTLFLWAVQPEIVLAKCDQCHTNPSAVVGMNVATCNFFDGCSGSCTYVVGRHEQCMRGAAGPDCRGTRIAPLNGRLIQSSCKPATAHSCGCDTTGGTVIDHTHPFNAVVCDSC